ncbi:MULTISPECIES: hypothetical protein [Chryseobacterium]|uniref:hypothetical protein n=1 Tax=Chryseobacterium TaxID=59732 RepID=UPI0016298334|nr:hypothetical protein [Chryseobacterium cucumeris]
MVFAVSDENKNSNLSDGDRVMIENLIKFMSRTNDPCHAKKERIDLLNKEEHPKKGERKQRV